MARHVARARRLRAALDRTGRMSFVDEVLVLPRAVAATTGRLVVDPAGLSLQRSRRCAP